MFLSSVRMEVLDYADGRVLIVEMLAIIRIPRIRVDIARILLLSSVQVNVK